MVIIMMLIAIVVAFAWIVLMKYFAGVMIWVSYSDNLEAHINAIFRLLFWA